MITEVEAASVTAIDAAEQERVRSYDPTVVDAQKARQSRADAEFVRDRLQAALPALQLRLQELQAQEYSVQPPSSGGARTASSRGHVTRHRSMAFPAHPLAGSGLEIVLNEIGGDEPSLRFRS
jgi:hypothetical protein